MKKNKSPHKKIFPVLLLIATVFMGIGYAALNATLNVSGSLVAQVQEGIFITEVNYKSSLNADTTNSKIISGAKTILGSKIYLSDSTNNSSITYTIKVYNKTSDKYVFTGVTVDNNFYDNANIVYSTTIESGKTISSGGYVTFDITFSYKSGYTPTSTTNSLESYLNFNFEKCYDVTYENVSGTHVNYAIANETFTVTFTSSDPIEVKMGGTTLETSNYTFTNKVLTIPNVTGALHIRKKLPYTITNLVKNGSFENGLNNWTVRGTASYWQPTPIAHIGSSAYYRKPSSALVNYISQDLNWVNGNKYYYFVHGISTTNQNLHCDVANRGGSIKVTVNPNYWSRGSSLFIPNFTGSNQISINYAEITTDVIVDSIGVINLTSAFGSGNEPSKEWCDSNINYFDGSMVVYK